MTPETTDEVLELIRRYYVALAAHEETGAHETLEELREVRRQLEAIQAAKMEAGTNRAP